MFCQSVVAFVLFFWGYNTAQCLSALLMLGETALSAVKILDCSEKMFICLSQEILSLEKKAEGKLLRGSGAPWCSVTLGGFICAS